MGLTVTTAMRRAVSFFGPREAVVHENTRLTFLEAWTRGCRMANALIAMGLKPGDRIGVLEDNSAEASDIFLGAAIANVVRVPLYPRNSREAHWHMLDHTGCRALIVAANHSADIAGIEKELPAIEHLLVRDDGYEAWLARQSPEDPMVPTDPEDNYIIRHTGGTTGRSKGVIYTHRGWLAATRDWFALGNAPEPGDKCIHVGPISHGSGYLFVPMWLGGGVNVMLDKFDAGRALELMAREGIAYLFAAPTMVNAFNNHPTARDYDWSKLKYMMVAGAPTSDATALTAREIFGEVLYQMYGQTEALPVSMMSPRQWYSTVEGSTPIRSCGRVLPYSEIEIWDEDNNPLPIGQSGQIAARTDGQMKGFWNDPQGMAERVVNGWVLTGDIGVLDDNGYLYVLDRSDDKIISGGFNIYPMELENAIASHPSVLEVAVYGIPDEKWGETPMASVVLKPNVPACTPQELIALCVERLGSYKKPGRVEIREEPLPKTPVGKIKRKELREPYWAGHARRVAGN